MCFFVFFVIFVVLISAIISNRAKFIPVAGGPVYPAIIKICYIISNSLTGYQKIYLFTLQAKATGCRQQPHVAILKLSVDFIA